MDEKETRKEDAEDKKEKYREYQREYHRKRYISNSEQFNKIRKSSRLYNKLLEANAVNEEVDSDYITYKEDFYDVYNFKYLLKHLAPEIKSKILKEYLE